MNETDYQVEYLGEEREPVVTIDNFSADADGLLNAASKADYGPGGRHYPGIRAKAPASYLQARGKLLSSVIEGVFGFMKGCDLIECNYSAVTTRPEELTPIQRLPHFDGTDERRLAVLHYLCPPEAGGTSFYRHCATGFETITEDRLANYDRVLQDEVAKDGLPPAQYFSGQTQRFARIGQAGAAFNRLIIYRGIQLHSGDILQADHVGDDLSRARITINTFLRAR